MKNIQTLKTYGTIKIGAFDIAETYNAQGEYTGHYRILHVDFPDGAGVRAKSATEALRIIQLPMAEIIHKVESL